MEKEIKNIQLAWFFSTDYTSNFEKVALALKEKFGESKVTQYIPAPSEAPSEIPRLILGYEKFNINISKNRTDLFLKGSEFILNKDIIPKINDVLIDNLNLSIRGIGFVKTFFVNEDVKILKELLPKEKVDNVDLKEIVIRINSSKKICGYECNNIENLSNGFVIEINPNGEKIKTEGIILVRDINTLVENFDNTFNKGSIIEIVSVFDKESDGFILWQR